MSDDEFDTRGSYVTEGAEYTRDQRYLTDRILASGDDPAAGRWPVEAGRYRLVVSRDRPSSYGAAITLR